MQEQLSKKAETVSAVLKQLSHPARLKVLCCMATGEKTVNELVEYAACSQSWTSQFLTRMKTQGLIQSRKEGLFVYYRISDPKLSALMDAIYQIYCAPKTRRSGVKHE